MNSPSDSLGLLFIGHGTRSERGTRDFLTLAGRLADALPQMHTEPAFLELQQPDIAAGLTRLLERGARQIVLLPLLLFSAGHAKQDVPDEFAKALDELLQGLRPISGPHNLARGLSWNQAPHLGLNSHLQELTCRRIASALTPDHLFPSVSKHGNAAHKVVPSFSEQACLLMVGRGSRDPSATAEMHQYAHQVAEQMGFRHHRVAFVAMAEPSLPTVLRELHQSHHQKVVVVPHLLFDGDLLTQIHGEFQNAANQTPQRNWHLASILGHDVFTPGSDADLLVTALGQIALDAAKQAFSGVQQAPERPA